MNKSYLKDEGQFTISDYQKYIKAKEYENLYNLGNKNTEKDIENKYYERIYNLSISKIARNFTINFIDILNDLVDYFYKIINKKEQFNFNKFIIIFIKDERLIYTGILLVLLSLFIYFMDITT